MGSQRVGHNRATELNRRVMSGGGTSQIAVIVVEMICPGGWLLRLSAYNYLSAPFLFLSSLITDIQREGGLLPMQGRDLRVQFSCVKYIHIVVQEISETFSPCSAKSLCPVNISLSNLPHPLPLAATFLLYIFMILSTLDTVHIIESYSACPFLISLA